MPKIAAFPKAFMDELCLTGAMTLRQWIELAASLGIAGLEFYSGFLGLKDPAGWPEARRMAADGGLSIPMFCCSPDFTHPDPAFRRKEIDAEKHWIDATAALGGQYCRVLSGQSRPELSREEGLGYAAECIQACLEHAGPMGITLTIENHYKDNYWKFPEFAQKMDLFCALVGRIESPHFGVNYDPSNAYVAGDDPLELLERVKGRVVTMHASDRYLAQGTLEDLKKTDGVEGYARVLKHGVIGEGLNDYDRIFSTLRGVGFDGWVSIEDGTEGMDQLRRSVAFLRGKIARYWL
ncbi:MAG: myo-inositol catabolism protein IolH [Candidatus Aminicenantes bacterium RBG_16_63_16]|nr:MAG: myo-inositol catabolism protein IolH [Candidatus Aminicenantes bacterium RBG_16_63_16]